MVTKFLVAIDIVFGMVRLVHVLTVKDRKFRDLERRYLGSAA